MQTQVHPVHFEDFSGAQFERLAFAHLLRLPQYSDVDWYGQLGSDRGRDIICKHEYGATHIYQCANYRRLTFKKVEEDFDKIACGGRSKGAYLTIVVGGGVSGKMKDRVSVAAKARGFADGVVWSGVEFEERLRHRTPDLLKRFTEGVAFPEISAELVAFTADAKSLSDQQIIDALTIAFDRPAYKTPFHMESSLPRFKAAIAETIDTLNTGRTPSGKVLPSKNDIKDDEKRKAVAGLVDLLVALRASFDRFLAGDMIRQCGCGDSDCPVYMMHPDAVRDMDERRRRILREVQALNPGFDPVFCRFD